MAALVPSEEHTKVGTQIQRTATIRREQTEKNATNVFEKSNYVNVLGFKHLVDIEGVTGSIPRKPHVFYTTENKPFLRGFPATHFPDFGLCWRSRLLGGDFWRPVSASKNSVPGGRAFSVGPTALAPVFPTFGPPQFAIFGRRCNYSELSPSASTAARAALDVQHALCHDYDLLTD
jgi:hypothetical protein